MKLEDHNGFCATLPATTHVVQWGGAHVWKVGGKVFAIGGHDREGEVFVTFKCSDMTFDVLKEQPGCRPAPYLASRGMKWIQRRTSQSVDWGCTDIRFGTMVKRRKSAIFMPGSYWNLSFGNWSAGEGFAQQDRADRRA